MNKEGRLRCNEVQWARQMRREMKETGDIELRIRALEQDQVHGAGYFAGEALEIMSRAAERHVGENAREMLCAMWRAGSRLMGIRPSMSAGIIHAVTSLFEAVQGEFLQNPAICPLKTWVRERKDAIVRRLDTAVERSAENAAKLIAENATVMLFSYSSTLSRVMGKAAGKGLRVVIPESRPLCEGVTMARECVELGIETTLITDGQIGLFMRECDMALVGADAVLPSGAVVNKAGTSLVACAAKEQGIPFHAVAQSWKIHPEEEVELEEKSPEEVVQGNPGFRVRNVYFDITPSLKIGSIIAEDGALLPSEVADRAETIRGALRRFVASRFGDE